MVLARLGEAEPAAVLSGAFSAHFPPSISAKHENERLGIDEAQALARHALGEAAYSAALGRGAAMDDDEVAVTRWASSGGSPPCSQNPARKHRNHRRAWRGRAAGNDRITRQATCRSRAGAVSHHGHSSQPAGGDRPAAGQAA